MTSFVLLIRYLVMDALSLALQLAPPTEIIALIHEIRDWPSLEAQHKLCMLLNVKHRVTFPPPAKGWKYLFKCIEKDIESLQSIKEFASETDELFSDDFMELMVESQTANLDADNTGHLSFKSVTVQDCYVPIKVIQCSSQVGTKVWGAGVFLGELLQYKPDVLKGQVVLELGAGVGITGLLLGRALPSETQPAKIIMTDFHHEVVDLLAHNININESTTSSCVLEADVLDWSTVCSDDYLRYNSKIMLVADCTYSESGNINLVSALKCFLNTMSSTATTITTTVPGCTEVGSDEYLLHLVQENIPFMLIACTVRSPETYAHFVNLIGSDAELCVVNMSQWAADCFPARPVYYYAEDKSRINLLCIHLKLQ